MRLVWAQYALDGRDAIFTYIENENPKVAGSRRRGDCASRSPSPRFSRKRSTWPNRGTRELVMPRTPYIAAYMLMADRIRILRILHGAQIWPFAFGDE
ncbi:type II toxin-antitoxin system RelE/ParE family toxin [Ensifer sp. B1-9]|uniref:type II toxin-antitoxin system RelE/ParE family toxin n=1 Tax=Ensifer sp. B1-9 TaxID=3141455 RepID=UPI003D20E627